jgi:hypothetical protein
MTRNAVLAEKITVANFAHFLKLGRSILFTDGESPLWSVSDTSRYLSQFGLGMKFQFQQYNLRDNGLLNFPTIGESIKLTNYTVQRKPEFSQRCERIQTIDNSDRRRKPDGWQLPTVLKSVNFPQNRAFWKFDSSDLSVIESLNDSN